MHPMPTLFVSHGAPDFALNPGRIGHRLGALARSLPAPRAVLVVSPHWMSPAPRVTANERPGTIHDFRGFGPELERILYPAPGDPELAARVVDRLGQAGWTAAPDRRRGFDHGAWIPLLHLYPGAEVPVVQLSLPADLDADGALRFGEALASLAHEGVLIIGSGSLTHNLYEVFNGSDDASYAIEFAEWIRAAVADADVDRLAGALDRAPHAARAHPTTEHYLPLLIAAGAAGPLERTEVIEGDVMHEVLVMDGFVFGQRA